MEKTFKELFRSSITDENGKGSSARIIKYFLTFLFMLTLTGVLFVDISEVQAGVFQTALFIQAGGMGILEGMSTITKAIKNAKKQ